MTRDFALYDLDKTVLRHASYTPFLVFAAWRRAPWRLALLPLWILAMAGYKLGLWSRGSLKQFGLRLFLGGRVDEAALYDLGKAFTDKVIPLWVGDGAAATLKADRDSGYELVMVTAAMGFYATQIGERLGFADVIATGHRIEGGYCYLEGDNCYGPAKVTRVEEFLSARSISRQDCRFIFYSDSMSDAPLFDWADDAVFVDGSDKKQARAQARGWRGMTFR